MALLDDLVAVANDLTKSFELQADVLYYAYIGNVGGSGQRQYAAGVQRSAIYTKKTKQVRKFDGEMGISTAQIAFLDPTEVGEFDKIVVPVNGVLDASPAARDAAQPIIGLDAFVPATDRPILTEIYLG